MYEERKKGMNERTNVLMNEWTNEKKKEWTNEWTSERERRKKKARGATKYTQVHRLFVGIS